MKNYSQFYPLLPGAPWLRAVRNTGFITGADHERQWICVFLQLSCFLWTNPGPEQRGKMRTTSNLTRKIYQPLLLPSFLFLCIMPSTLEKQLFCRKLRMVQLEVCRRVSDLFVSERNSSRTWTTGNGLACRTPFAERPNHFRGTAEPYSWDGRTLLAGRPNPFCGPGELLFAIKVKASIA